MEVSVEQTGNIVRVVIPEELSSIGGTVGLSFKDLHAVARSFGDKLETVILGERKQRSVLGPPQIGTASDARRCGLYLGVFSRLFGWSICSVRAQATDTKTQCFRRPSIFICARTRALIPPLTQ